MATVRDVAAYILHECNVMTTMKMQKLTFYSQAESLANRQIPLFTEDFRAWRNGPVCVELFNLHKGRFLIEPKDLPYREGSLSDEERTVIKRVCESLSKFSGNQLSDCTHSESPWKDARGELRPDEPCATVIEKSVIQQYYMKHPVVQLT